MLSHYMKDYNFFECWNSRIICQVVWIVYIQGVEKFGSSNGHKTMYFKNNRNKQSQMIQYGDACIDVYQY